MNLFEQLILEADAEAAEIEKLKQSSAKIKEVQSEIDKMPDGKDKQEMQNILDSAIKDLSAREQKTAPKPSAVATPPPADQNQAQQPPKPSAVATPPPAQQPAAQSPAPSAVATPPQNANEKETELMKKLHGSFDPKSKTDLKKLEQLRTVQQQLGQNANMKDLSKAVYSKQYAKDNQPQPQAQAQANQQQTQPPPSAAPVTPTTTQTQTPESPTTTTQQSNKTRAAAQGITGSEKIALQQSVPSPEQSAPVVANKNDARKQANVKRIAAKAASLPQQNQVAKNEQPKKDEKSEAEEEKSKKFQHFGLNKITVQEKNNISKFLMHLSEKNYSSAHKYLKAIVNSKINKIVSERIDKI
jgi:hypothetical protein